jgi:hypothetical protein
MSDKSDRSTPGRAWDQARFHDAFCETHGHDPCCPPTQKAPSGVLRDPKTGHLVKGTVSLGKRLMPGRLKDARKYIAQATNNGEVLLRRLLYLSGAFPDLGRQQDIIPSGPVQVRALRELREIFYGRAIHLEGKVGVDVSGSVQHTHRAEPSEGAVEVARLTDDELAQLRAMAERVKSLPPGPKRITSEPGQDVSDAEFEEVTRPEAEPDPENSK